MKIFEGYIQYSIKYAVIVIFIVLLLLFSPSFSASDKTIKVVTIDKSVSTGQEARWRVVGEVKKIFVTFKILARFGQNV